MVLFPGKFFSIILPPKYALSEERKNDENHNSCQKLETNYFGFPVKMFVVRIHTHMSQNPLVKPKSAFGQIHFAIGRNTFCNWEKYSLQLEKIHFAIGINTFCKWDKYILQSGEIHFAIGKNQFCNWEKYILQLGQIHQDCVSEMGCTLLRKHSRHH